MQGLSFSKDKDSINFLSSDAIMLVAIVGTTVVIYTRLPDLLKTTKFVAVLAAAGFAAKMYIDRRPASQLEGNVSQLEGSVTNAAKKMLASRALGAGATASTSMISGAISPSTTQSTNKPNSFLPSTRDKELRLYG